MMTGSWKLVFIPLKGATILYIVTYVQALAYYLSLNPISGFFAPMG